MSAATRTARPPRHIPERTCIACRTKGPKREFVRIVRAEAGVEVDPSGRAPGRGAYLCNRASCWRTAETGRSLAQALRTTLSDADRARLAAFAAGLSERESEAHRDN
ncbi:MAG: YlxR family protein [Dehalococcoidia bacterium]